MKVSTSRLRDLKEIFLSFVCLFVYLIIFAIRGRFILFTFFGVFPHFSIRIFLSASAIRHPQVSAVRVLQTPLPSCCVSQFIQRTPSVRCKYNSSTFKRSFLLFCFFCFCSKLNGVDNK